MSSSFTDWSRPFANLEISDSRFSCCSFCTHFHSIICFLTSKLPCSSTCVILARYTAHACLQYLRSVLFCPGHRLSPCTFHQCSKMVLFCYIWAGSTSLLNV